MKLVLSFLIFAYFVADSKATIQVTLPSTLSDRLLKDLGNRTLLHQISTFGYVDYQGFQNFQILPWPTKDACNIENLDESKASLQKLKKNHYKMALLVEHPGIRCSFLKVAANTMKLGGETALVYMHTDSNPMFVTTPFNVKDGISYPPLNFILRKAGLIISDALKSNQEVEININYELEKREGFITAVFWYSFENPDSLEIMKNIIKYQTQFKGLVDFQFIFRMYDSDSLEISSQPDTVARYCFGSGTYCIRPSNDISKLKSPRELMLEGLKISCVTETAENSETPQLAIDYLQDFMRLCLFKDQIGECSLPLLNKFRREISKDAESAGLFDKCTKEVASVADAPEDVHPSLDMVHIQNSMYGNYNGVPSLFINTQIVRGTLTASLAVSAICDSLVKPPKVCSSLETELRKDGRPASGEVAYEDVVQKEVEPSYGLLKLLVVVTTSIIIFVLLYFAPKVLKNLVRSDVATEIYHQIRAQETLPPIRKSQPLPEEKSTELSV